MSDILREEGVVVDVGEKGALVRLSPAAPENCGACGLCSRDASSARTLRLPADERVGVGARVAVEIRRPNPAAASLVLFFLPLVLVGGGIIAGAALARVLGLPAWPLAAAAGALGLATWTRLLRRAERRWKRHGALGARITRVLGGPGSGGGDA